MCVSLGKFDDIPLNQGGSSYSHSRGRGPHSPTGLFAWGYASTFDQAANQTDAQTSNGGIRIS